MLKQNVAMKMNGKGNVSARRLSFPSSRSCEEPGTSDLFLVGGEGVLSVHRSSSKSGVFSHGLLLFGYGKHGKKR